MNWLAIDAVDGAFKRTKKALLEPFDFWKWIKLGIIIILIGGGSFYNTGGGSPPSSSTSDEPFNDTDEMPVDEITDQLSRFWHEYFTLILITIIFILFIILLFSYISNVMEFVLVESLVTDTVAFLAYSRKYLSRGFHLFILRLILALFFISLLVLAMQPVLMQMAESFENISSGMIFGFIVRLLVVLLAIIIVNGIIQSFINLSIPLVMYNDLGIIAAFKKILYNFKEEWEQMAVYWVVRFVLGLIAGAVAGVIILILFLILLIILAIPGVILYLVLSGVGLGAGNALFWIVMIPYGLMGFVLVILFILLASAPVGVFMKYHMLTFLQSWYTDARIPFS